MDSAKLRERLKETRKKYKYTQQNIADILNIDRSTYAKYENGQAVPPLYTLVRLATIYGVNIDYLSGRKSQTKNTLKDSGAYTKEKARFLSCFQNLNEEQRNMTLEFMMKLINENEEKASGADVNEN